MEKFVVFDLETVYNKEIGSHFICQIGLVVVSKGEIVDSYNQLVKPPYNMYDIISSRIHGLSSVHTFDKEEFNVIWNEVREYLEIGRVYYHSRSNFDKSVLLKTLTYYGLDIPEIDFATVDNLKLFKLDALREYYEIDKEGAHDALKDSVDYANILLMYFGGKFDYEVIYQINESIKKGRKKNTKSEKIVKSYFETEYFSNEEPKEKKQKEVGKKMKLQSIAAYEGCVFNKRGVALLGKFPYKKSDMKAAIELLGGESKGSPSKNSHYVVLGDEIEQSDIEQLKDVQEAGFGVVEVSFNQFMDVVNNRPVTVPTTKEELDKDFHFTYEYLVKHRTSLDHSSLNILSGKECYLRKEYYTTPEILSLMLGHLSAYSNYTYDNTITTIIISETEIEALKNGNRIGVCMDIETLFRGQTNTIKFQFEVVVIESLKHYLETRSEKNKQLRELFNRCQF